MGRQTPTAYDSHTDRSFFGHPRPLATLFGVEMWERFSFYGMQGILAIYLYYSASRGGLGLDEGAATSIVGAYGGLVYLSTILGAWLADRLLGEERVLFFSAVVIVVGHLSLAVVPGLAGVGVGLVCIALGSGGVKANATSMVGTLYDAGDPRRDGGFSLFYLGINLGAFLGPLLTGLAQTELGFHYGFGLAAIGMTIGLVQYVMGRHRIPPEARVVPHPLPVSQYLRWIVVAVGIVAVIAGAALTGLLTAENLSDVVVWTVLLASVAYFAVILSSRRITAAERSRVVAFIPLFVTSTAFWALYQQQFTVVPIYADKQLDRDVLGWEMPVAWVNSINPVYIIVLAGVFAALWTRLGSRQPSTPIKFAGGAVVMGLGFLLFLPFANAAPSSVPLMAMVLILLVFTIAELLISPVGLSVSTKLAPQAFQTQMVALFFLSVSLGSALSGTLAKQYTRLFDAGQEGRYFGILGAMAIAIGLALAVISPWVLRQMRGVR
ncbi:peptide MFS transporter [Mumia zhuanghuii]|uniref:Peptide MFS transporter n=1 Tax=Mumia zhuanghuii TaxID=2585211 RepID=A0A5C4MLR3_9ACTN|nr:peptide MFS transporter [Mumia zhuanghuii]TNC34382.1 peptide MFS transporter [Mumia zhuanghuii]TNC46507.1 peptide MFS transporter [Mumia zhuanghuii]